MSGGAPARTGARPSARLWVVLDQLVSPTDPDLATASLELARALVRTAPVRCEVAAIVPAGAGAGLTGVAEVHRTRLARRELAASWQLGVVGDARGGMIHSPTLLAPLARHDRRVSGDQTVPTVWDLSAWDRTASDGSGELPRAQRMWQRAMLKRAEKHADAVVVPTHAHAARLDELCRLGGRLRVIPGSAPTGFVVPPDAVGRRRTLGLPEGVVAVSGATDAAASLAAVGAASVDVPVVVLDVQEGGEPRIADLAAAAGIAEGRLHVRGALGDHDRAAVLDGALALVDGSTGHVFPWRAVEALALGIPVVASASAVHTEVLGDGAALADGSEALGAALAEALGSAEAHRRRAVLAADRGRSFSWDDAADRVWALHAEL